MSVHQLLCISWFLVSYSINLCSYYGSRKHRKGSGDPEPANEGDTEMEYFSDRL